MRIKRRYYQVISILLISILLFSFTQILFAKVFFTKSKPKVWKKIEKLYNSFAKSPLVQISRVLIEILPINLDIWDLKHEKTVVIASIRGQTTTINSNQLRILTSNMFLLPYPFASEHKARIKLLRRLANKLRPDLISLQEVWRNKDLYSIIEQFPEYNCVYESSKLFNRSGLLVLSKYRVIDSEKVIFPMSLNFRLQELIAQKGFIKATIQFGKRKVNFVGLHLYSATPYDLPRPNYDQFAYIVQYIKDLKLPTIVAGDFNLIPEAVEKINSKRLIVSTNRENTAGIRPNHKVDYIMIDPKKLKLSEFIDHPIKEPRLSDHLPLFSVINIGK